MHPILKGILAVVGGWLVGSILNMSLVQLGPMVIPNPEGFDMSTPESMRASMEMLEARHLVFPWLAHALGTFLGAFVAAWLAPSRPMAFALGIGLAFFLGGITMVALAGGPMWFIVADLALAYFPMAWLGGRLAMREAPAQG